VIPTMTNLNRAQSFHVVKEMGRMQRCVIQGREDTRNAKARDERLSLGKWQLYIY